MRSHSFQSLLFSGLVSASAAAAGADVLTSRPTPKLVTVWVESTVTTCPLPTPPPPPCSAVPPTSTLTLSSIVTITSGAPGGASATPSSPSSTQSSTGWSTTTPSTTTTTTSTSTTHTSTSTTATPPSCTDYWLGTIKHQGLAPYSGNSTYQVFRNVKDYGAKGDGSTDDTDAINKAISDGNRCAPTRGACTGSTVTPALVYFPPGTYVVSKPIIMYYYTSLIGNPSCLPTIKATAGFFGRWVLDSNQYQTDGKLGWGATNVFFRQVANFIFDLTQPTNGGFEALSAIHWPSSQATSLSNIVIHLNKDKTVPQQGIFIEEGSGGFVGDIVIDGGWHALEVGNQQFTFRNISISNSGTAVKQSWSWGWTYQEIKINKCDIGFDIANDAGSVGSITVLDSEIANTPVGINFGVGSSAPPVSNNIIIENLKLNNVPTAVQGPSGTVLSGSAGAVTIPAWGRGNSYTANSGPSAFQGSFTRHSRPSDLLAGSVYYTRSKPQYESEPLSNILSARTAGAKGDGVTDDTLVLNTLFALAASTGKVVFLDAGYYLVTSTIKIPAGSRVTGEGYPIILSSGAFFNDATKPQPVVQIGKQGDQGSIEWSNAIVSTKGAQAGAILIEYNLKSPKSAPSGLWDVHVRIGGFAGSDLQFAQCQKTPGTTITSANLQKECISGFLSVHVTKQSSGLLMENCWIWVADHDLEIGANNQQITIYAGRGLLIESTAGDIWLYGTAVEHHQLYEYQLVGTQDIVMGQIQTETAYYQRNPDATIPFAAVPQYSDPVFSAGDSGWGLRVVDSKDIIVYGAGLYSFFNNYSTSCSDQGNGSTCQKRIFSVEGDSKISVYNLNTVGTTRMFTVDGVDKASYADNNDGFVQTIAKVQIPS
ncbi:hypothetical protein QBC47DRAFT_292345 [Echria macrotheca]|uniref:Rhamnogalacturonase A/B/Epimerase-like pectate lyase domain-containing protein n=1 Tax=Echria macrotheca TaxID=438768 RepID=A0AAJ0BKA8_9PEZI|nr:hypothetical protein QBC47DRAFT_292345 [Echria macrotheca]